MRADDDFVERLAASLVTPRDVPAWARGTNDELTAMLAAWVAEVRPEAIATPGAAVAWTPMFPESAGSWIGGTQRRAAERGAHQGLSAVDLQISATAAHHDLVVLHDDADFVMAARCAVELRQRNVHDGPLE